MKALCLKQPYASWVADGPKTIETRTWKTNFRGRFLVVASLGIDLLRELGFEKGGGDFWARNIGDFKICGSKEIQDGFFPRGVALAEATVYNCRRMIEDDEKAACCEWYDGAWAWLLADVVKIKPFPVKGQLSFFEVPYEELTEAA